MDKIIEYVDQNTAYKIILIFLTALAMVFGRWLKKQLAQRIEKEDEVKDRQDISKENKEDEEKLKADSDAIDKFFRG